MLDDSPSQIIGTLFLLALVYWLIQGSFSALTLGLAIAAVLTFMALGWARY